MTGDREAGNAAVELAPVALVLIMFLAVAVTAGRVIIAAQRDRRRGPRGNPRNTQPASWWEQGTRTIAGDRAASATCQCERPQQLSHGRTWELLRPLRGAVS